MLYVASEAPVISIKMSMSGMWFMVFGIASLAKFIGMLFVTGGAVTPGYRWQ